MVLFVNILLYVLFSAFLFVVARVIPMPKFLRAPNLQHPPSSSMKEKSSEEEEPLTASGGWWEEKKLMDGSTTVALLFCGAAKGPSLLAHLAIR